MNPSLTYITLNDFKPGIIQRLGQSRSGFGPAPLGAAAADGTYRCYALPGGGLAPLPRRTFSMYATDSGTSFNGATTVYNTGLKVTSIVFGPTTTGTTPQFRIRDINGADLTTSLLVYMGHEFISPLTPTEQRIAFTRHHWTTTFGYWSNAFISSLSGAPAYITNRMSPAYLAQVYLKDTTGGSPFRSTVMNVGKAQDTTTTQAFAGILSGEGLTFGFTGGAPFGIVVGHQGRAVFFRRTSSSYLALSGVLLQSNDLMQWTKVQDAITDTAADVNYFPELPFGIGAWASVSASDLFVVKHQGGGVLIQGDLNNPLIRRLPAVPSTNGSECVGIMSQGGFVYGVNRGGVYVWQGGDGAELLSPQLDNDFWIPSSMDIFVDFRGQFSSIGSWVLCPNNWLYDFSTQSWWRLEDPSTLVLTMMDVDGSTGSIYGTPLSFDPSAVGTQDGTPNLYGFKPNQGATNYKWTSQPIFLSDTHEVTVDEIILTVQGSGTVTITINDDPCTFDNIASPTSPVRIRKSFGKRFDIMRVVIESTETIGGVIGAPVVYDVKLGIKEKITLPTS